MEEIEDYLVIRPGGVYPTDENSSAVGIIDLGEDSNLSYISNTPNDTFNDSPHEDNLEFIFIVNGIGITLVALLGIIGNSLSVIVLSRPQMRSSVSCLLLGLSTCDALLVFISILIFALPAISDYTGTLKVYRFTYYPLWVPYLFPISITAQTASVYLTLGVTIERWIAVCHPLRARSICTWRRAKICVTTVILFSILYNLPRWWEVKTNQGYHYLYNMTIYENIMSTMRQNSWYISIYINWAYLVVMYLVPFSSLVIFNLAIYQQIRKANCERQVLSKHQRRELGLATMLLCVVVVFLLCNVLPLVNNILESFNDKLPNDYLVHSSNFLVIVNSSVNFVIYCTCGERFRRLLLRICRDFIWCRIGGTKRRTSSLRHKSDYRKSNYYRNGDYEEVSLASIGNTHTVLTTPNGNGNGTLLVDVSVVGRGYRSKTIPATGGGGHNYSIQAGNGKLNANRRVSSPVQMN